MQWYEGTSKKLEAVHRYSHQELIRLLKNDYPQTRDSSYHWAVCGMLKSGNLTKVARNVYPAAKTQHGEGAFLGA